ncbi:MAG: 3-dehydroquinate synthase [Elusimicrobiota bacterium]
MNQPISLQVCDQTSEIWVGQPLSRFVSHLAHQAAVSGTQVGIICDAAVASSYGKALKRELIKADFAAELFVVPSGEKSKSLAQASRLYRLLARRRFERRSWLIAVGGGVVGDLTGFVAATYLRGIQYVQMPTTLLAQVDSSIGGKTGVDLPEGKNLVGSFCQARIVWIDPTLLRTLPKEHWRNGLAEVIKYGAIYDAKLFSTLEEKIDILKKGYSPLWMSIIARCAEIKAEIVQDDPVEIKGKRAILNFGHSVGHAIEAAGGYKTTLHGEAISIGMFVAGYLSSQMGLLEPVDRIRLGTLLTQAGLPSRVKRPIPREQLMQFLARDKKVEDGIVKFVLLQSLGKAVSCQTVPPDLLDPALAASGL